MAWRQGVARGRPLHHRRPDDGHDSAVPRGTRDLVAEFPNLAAYLKRGEARPAFQRALADQLAVFREHQPQGRSSSMTYFEGFIVAGAGSEPRRLREARQRVCSAVRREFGVARHGRGLGRRRARRQGHRLPQGGRRQARREGRLLLLRISLEAGARRREREVHERPAHGGHGQEHARSTASA